LMNEKTLAEGRLFAAPAVVPGATKTAFWTRRHNAVNIDISYP